MQERAIHFSSINRQKIGKNQPEDFIIKFELTLKLDPDINYELAMDRVSMTYSWHNINAEYGNNEIKYSPDNGSNWKTIRFLHGMYSYSDLDEYIKQVLVIEGDKGDDDFDINLIFVLSSYRVVIQLSNNFQLDLRKRNFGDLIGFNFNHLPVLTVINIASYLTLFMTGTTSLKTLSMFVVICLSLNLKSYRINQKIITRTEYSSRLPNITNSIDSININCDMISERLTDGTFSNTLAVIPTDNLTRSYPFSFEPKRALFSPVTKTTISEIRITVTDSLGRTIDLNGKDWFMSLILRSV